MRKLSAGVLAIVVAGCGGGGNGGDDGAPDAAGERVSIRVTGAAGPAQGVLVRFQAADSSLVAQVTTDPDGVATAAVEAGGFVTVFDPSGTGTGDAHEVVTYAGVKPGDQLVLDARPATAIRTIHVTAPLDPDPDIAHYRIAAQCAYGGPVEALAGADAITADLQVACDLIDLLITAEVGGTASIPVHYLYLPDQTVSDGATYAVTGDYVPMRGQLVTAIDPDGVVDTTTRTIVTPRGPLYSWTDHDVLSGTSLLANIPPLPNSIERMASTLASPGPLEDQQTIGDTVIDPCEPYTISVDQQRLPWFSNPPVFVPARRAVEWTERPGGVTPDVAWARGTSQAGDVVIVWRIVGPHDGPSLRFPDLSDAPVDPAAADDTFLSFVNIGRAPGGYDALRARAWASSLDLWGQTSMLSIIP